MHKVRQWFPVARSIGCSGAVPTSRDPPAFGAPQQVWEDGRLPSVPGPGTRGRREAGGYGQRPGGRESGAVRHMPEYPEYLAAVVFAAGGVSLPW